MFSVGVVLWIMREKASEPGPFRGVKMSDLEKPDASSDLDFPSMPEERGDDGDYLSGADLLEQELASVGESPEPEPEPSREIVEQPAGAADEWGTGDADAELGGADGVQDDVSAQDAAALSEEEQIPEWLPGAIEAVAFLSTEPATVGKIRDLLGEQGEKLTSAVIRRAMRELVARWQESRPVATGIVLVEIGGAIAFRTAPENGRFLRQMNTAKPQRLSRAALETLSIVAYRQPLTRPQIDEIRGVDSSGAVRALLDKRLLRILGKADDIGRPLLYGTTKTFLDFFGLATLRDLPTLKEFHELQGDEINADLLAEAMEQGVNLPQGSVVMDLFEPTKVGKLVSATTADESDEALDGLESALGHAVATAKRLEDPNAPMTEEAKAEWRARQEAKAEESAEEGDLPSEEAEHAAAGVEVDVDESADSGLESTFDASSEDPEIEAVSEFSKGSDAGVENGVDETESSG